MLYNNHVNKQVYIFCLLFWIKIIRKDTDQFLCLTAKNYSISQSEN